MGAWPESWWTMAWTEAGAPSRFGMVWDSMEGPWVEALFQASPRRLWVSWRSSTSEGVLRGTGHVASPDLRSSMEVRYISGAVARGMHVWGTRTHTRAQARGPAVALFASRNHHQPPVRLTPGPPAG